MTELFDQDKHPEQLYRPCDGLLSLLRKVETGLFRESMAHGVGKQDLLVSFYQKLFGNLEQQAGFRHKASVEELKTDAVRGLNRQLIAKLSKGKYIEKGEAFSSSGPPDAGKVFWFPPWDIRRVRKAIRSGWGGCAFSYARFSVGFCIAGCQA